jgi:hypothetical protein
MTKKVLLFYGLFIGIGVVCIIFSIQQIVYSLNNNIILAEPLVAVFMLIFGIFLVFKTCADVLWEFKQLPYKRESDFERQNRIRY